MNEKVEGIILLLFYIQNKIKKHRTLDSKIECGAFIYFLWLNLIPLFQLST
ncbi:hypothetical protein HMPREF0621_1252 [Pasteurella dagmatis ATCC 43325]|uniref:Uncharacterized protein n=1 Tax=Pasteurella dagmatis ATCC 43325 TaxID=667128 RepID=C9PQQ9_9PAST|nr:hypothetical protein HMPREF0621_1252 [Pasteurella dagmatis ATCC 43325]